MSVFRIDSKAVYQLCPWYCLVVRCAALHTCRIVLPTISFLLLRFWTIFLQLVWEFQHLPTGQQQKVQQGSMSWDVCSNVQTMVSLFLLLLRRINQKFVRIHAFCHPVCQSHIVCFFKKVLEFLVILRQLAPTFPFSGLFLLFR